MPTVLVTGPTGFVGSGLIRELLRRGARLRAFARPAWKDRNILFSGETDLHGVELFYGDIRDT